MPILLQCFLLGWVVAAVWSTSVCWLMLTATKAAENHLNETLPSPTSEPAAASRAVVRSASAQGLLQVVLCSGHRHDNKSVPTRTGGGAHNGSYHKADTWKYRIHQVQAGCWRAVLVPHCFMSLTPVNQYINDSEWAGVCGTLFRSMMSLSQ